MRTITEPVNFEQEGPFYQVVGYYREKAIARDEEGNLFFLRCEEEEAPIGTVIPGGGIQTIEKLAEEERDIIQNIYGRE